MRPVSIIVFTAGVILGAAASSDGCTCITAPAACQSTWEAGAVFIADVVKVEDAQRTTPGPSRRIQLRVAESFRGDVQGLIDVFTGQGGGDCGFPFVAGQRYLVYANRFNDGYQTGICHRTRRIDEAADDLGYLREMSKRPSAMASIVGTVTHAAPDSEGYLSWRTPFANARIVAEGAGRRYEATSGQDGRYSIPVAAGAYAFSVQVPSNFYVRPLVPSSETVFVRDARGCASVDVTVLDNGRITGRVLDSTDRPISGLTIEAQSVRPSGYRPGSYLPSSTLAVTNGDGNYELAALQPGNYTLGIFAGTRISDRNPDTRIQLTGAGEPIALAAGQTLLLGDAMLPRAVTIAPIAGVVRRPDGTPAAGARIYVYAESVPNKSINKPLLTDASGRFSLSLVGGRYRLLAELRADDGRRLLRSEAFADTSTVEALEMRLSLP